MGEAYGRALSAKHSFYCVTGEELSKSYKPFLPLLKICVEQLGGSSTIITSIDNKPIIHAVNELTAAGAQVKHIKASELRRCVIFDDDVAYFSIIEPTITREATQTVDETEGDDLWIGSTEPSVVQSAKKRFFEDWEKTAIPSKDRINELEKGEPIEVTRVIKDNKEAVQVYKSLAGRIRREVLYLIPTTRAFVRAEKEGIFDLIIEAVKNTGAKVRILCPVEPENFDIVDNLEKSARHIQVQEHEPTTSTILVVDREHLFASELSNDDMTELYQTINFSFYSNSKPTIESHVALFESLWKQKSLYAELERVTTKLSIANDELKIKENMQIEFINIAAHELRTPIQPILGMANILESRAANKDGNAIKLWMDELDIIIRNAQRLERLASEILQVARIEAGLIQANKTPTNFKEIIQRIVPDLRRDSEKAGIVISDEVNDALVSVDQQKISEVIFNLLENAIKFTQGHGNRITISTQVTDDFLLVSIKDTGSGIDPEIMPRLFTKFATKSEKGTGLGLFISKSIIEAHGGKIWAQNNSDGKGATFTFTLPMTG